MSDPTRADLATRNAPAAEPDRWRFLRDVVVFQLKLVVDGLRDTALVPVSIVAAVIDLATGRSGADRLFYRSVVFGRRSEDWIDLFEAADRVAPAPQRVRAPGAGGLDQAFANLEQLVVEQHARGGITATAKDAIDRALDRVSASSGSGRRGGSGGT